MLKNVFAERSNGADIPGKDTFTKNIGACRYGALSTETGNGQTAQFIEWLDSVVHLIIRTDAKAPVMQITKSLRIPDVVISTAGCVVEVRGTKSAITIRVTTPTTSSGGGMPTSAQFTYINHGDGYSPAGVVDWNRQATQ